MGQRGAAQQQAPAGNAMFTMLIMMLLMLLLISQPGLRSFLAGAADPIFSPTLPETTSFVITVMALGSFSIVLNTVLRHAFTDPIEQAHLTHRSSQLRKWMREAQILRNVPKLEQAREFQQQMMPDQMALQSKAMKPMIYTFVFIIAIFSRAANIVGEYRVDFVSLPFAPIWGFDRRFMFFPAWICVYIVMSAPLGRIVDRHLRVARLSRHPLVISGDVLPEPLLMNPEIRKTPKRRSQKQRSRRPRPSAPAKSEEDSLPSSSGIEGTCPACEATAVELVDRFTLSCSVCFETWGR